MYIIIYDYSDMAENIIAEEQAGFRGGRSTIEQIFNLRIQCEKHLQHQRNIYHILIEGLRQSMARSTMDNHEKVQHQREAH